MPGRQTESNATSTALTPIKMKEIDTNMKEVVKSLEKRKTNYRETLKKLFEVAKSEIPTISLAMVALVVNSITNLSFPQIIGKALDFPQGSGGDILNSSANSILSVLQEYLPNGFLLQSLGYFCIGSIASYLRVYCLGKSMENITKKLRLMLFHSLLLQDIEYYENTELGEMISLLQDDVQIAAELFTEKLANGLRSFNSSFNGSIMLYNTSPKLCTVALSVIPVVGIGAMTLSKYSRKINNQLRENTSKTLSYSIERLNCITTVRLNNREKFELDKFYQLLLSSDQIANKRYQAQGAFMSFINIATNMSLVCVLHVGGGMISRGEISMGTLTSFALQSAFVGLGFSGLSTFYSDAVKALDAADRVFTVIEANKNTSIQLEEIIQSSKSGHTTTPQITSHEHPATPASSNSTPRISRRPSINAAAINNSIILESDNTHTRISSIQLFNVSFAYSSRQNQNVLNHINLTIEPYQITVFIGKSGSGKSSLAGLLCGLYHPTGGYIAYGKNIISSSHQAKNTTNKAKGKKVNPNKKSKTTTNAAAPSLINPTTENDYTVVEHDNNDDDSDIDQEDDEFYYEGATKNYHLPPFYNLCGVVEQSSAASLFSGTIAENIAYGKYSATKEEIEEAAMAANAHDFISSFPLKYETDVGSGGSMLSGGQRARIALARALIRSPPYLVLDEPTAALDASSEIEVISPLTRLKQNTTIIIFTHSEVVKNIADKIYELNEDGQLVQLK